MSKRLNRANGYEHRNPDEGPAYIRRAFLTGKVIVEEYIVDSKHDRAGRDLPAALYYDEQGVRRKSSFLRWVGFIAIRHSGLPGPATIHKQEPSSESFTLYAVRKHRDPAEGPAVRLWSRVTGKLLAELYYVEDRLHRDPKQGAAFIRYRVDGSVSKEVYHQCGKRVPVSENPDRPSGGIAATSRSELRRRFARPASI